MKDSASGSYNLDLFADEEEVAAAARLAAWPDASRFPLNVAGERVGAQVLADIKGSNRPLIVTGYASLDRLIDLAAGVPSDGEVRVLLGSEPFPSRRTQFSVGGRSFPKEVENYWLERGVSLLLSGKLVRCIERLKEGVITARYLASPSQRLHAKIYVGDEAATVGSSNFTHQGLGHQLEANVRFRKDKEAKRYRELRSIAENYWALGSGYTAELIALLEQLLKVVSWEEALAKACAELLEGEWAKDYVGSDFLFGDVDLWPAQRQGIAQALYVLSQQGSVLIADATGSGKTRMGIHLIQAMQSQILRSGRLRKGKALMVCPPAVAENWEWESHRAGMALDTYSHGSLSHRRSGKHDLTLEALRRAQILCVDEGHNFLNIKSNRTQHLLRNMADHVLLFTATPINRSVVDLLRITDMLGADNLDPSTLGAFRKMLGVRSINRSLTEDEIEALRKEIQRFTVRRTKRMLNRLIDREPEHYRDRSGNPCRFPKHLPKIYRLNESTEDRAIAARIRDLADRLHGVSHFVRPLEMPEVLARQGWPEETYLKGRLLSAKKIARYLIMASIRSSRLALAEHIVGTKLAVQDFKLPGFQKHTETGDILGVLERIAGSPSGSRLNISPPRWLTTEEAHAEVCEQDMAIYREIYDLLRNMTSAREQAKAAQLVKLAKKHVLLLAFDSRPITLATIQRLIEETAPGLRTVVATGDPSSSRNEMLETFKPGSEAVGVVGLCSDSLSEGVNLQQASALVHLDMPSVVRIAEQRVGRVDRMDSPHRSIEAWWPEDAPEFALSTDERFVERYETVESLLGSNMPLPDSLQASRSKLVRANDLVREFEKAAEKAQWDGIEDAFQPVRDLILGKHALVSEDVYDHYLGVSANVLARVSLVKAVRPWAFFCLSAGAFWAPRWIFMPDLGAAPVTDLAEVCEALRERVGPETSNLAMDAHAAALLNQFLLRINEAERLLLPRKKQKALEEMGQVLERLLEVAAKNQDEYRVHGYRALLDMLRKRELEHQPDWDEVAGRWLDIIRPIWYQRLQQPRNRPLLLKDIRKDLLNPGDEFGDKLIAEFSSFPMLRGADERVTACIVGVT